MVQFEKAYDGADMGMDSRMAKVPWLSKVAVRYPAIWEGNALGMP